MKASINTAIEGKRKPTELLLGAMWTCFLQEMVFGCSGVMPQYEWVPHDSDVDITTDCPYGITVIAPLAQVGSTSRSTGSTIQAHEEFL